LDQWGAECTGATVLDDLLVAFVDPCITKVQKKKLIDINDNEP
jgi:hypothetical protein